MDIQELLNTVWLGKWEEEIKKIPDKSIDLIFTDLPYTNGSTGLEWDKTPVNLDLLWFEYERIIKPKGAILLFADMLFGSRLITSNPKWFKYDIIWQKGGSNSPGLAKLRPMPIHEHLLVFSPKKCKITYNPQMRTGFKVWWKTNSRVVDNPGLKLGKVKYGYYEKESKQGNEEGERYPVSVIETSKVNYPLHPNQKPLELIEWGIKTYSNPNETVLDNTAGSGTTAIAAMNTGRNYILIEQDPAYYKTILDRIANNPKKLNLGEGLAG